MPHAVANTEALTVTLPHDGSLAALRRHFYLTLGEALDRPEDDPSLAALADEPAACVDRMADAEGEDYVDDADIPPPFVQLMDALAFDMAPPARRLIELLEERGWTGWTKLRRVDTAPGASLRSPPD